MTTIPTLANYGIGAKKQRIPVSLPGQRHILGWTLMNTYFQEILGPRTSGAVLNVGAGRASRTFRHAEMFAADEYHTLETPGSEIEATYKCNGEAMTPVPSERYDWVISTVVLEHTLDPWAVTREMLRVTKPGGFVYASAPFSHQVHAGPSYGDYWRFSPLGLAALFPGCRVREVEVWGDDPIMPSLYSILVQKPPFEEAPAGHPYVWLDFPNEQPWLAITPDEHTSFEWPIYSLNNNEINISAQLHSMREQIEVATGVFVPIHQVARGSIHLYARRVGTLGFRGDQSFVRGV
jgi:SAM-dependent methyltransferase